MEELYEQRLKNEIESIIGTMSDIPPSVYDGEDALQGLLSSIRMIGDGYTFKMIGVEHDRMIEILAHIKDIGIPSSTRRVLPKNIRDEFTSLDLLHLTGYMKFHKNGHMSIQIDDLPFSIIKKIASILFMY